MTNIQPIKILPNSSPRLASIGTPKSKIKLVSGKEMHIVPKSEILFLKSDSNYCEVHLTNGKVMLCSQTLKAISEKLKSSSFFRPHNSYVINVNFLSSVNTSVAELTLNQSIIIPISRSNRADLKNMMEVWFD